MAKQNMEKADLHRVEHELFGLQKTLEDMTEERTHLHENVKQYKDVINRMSDLEESLAQCM
jgi:hypothetical protein